MRLVAFLLDTGLDRLISVALACLALWQTPAGHGVKTWGGCLVVVGLILWTARPEAEHD